MTNYATAIAFMAAILAPSARADVDGNYWKINWGSGTCYYIHPDDATGMTGLFDDLAACCHNYFTQDDSYNDCITGGGGTPEGSDDWYIDWGRTPNACSKNCAEGSADGCGGFLSPHTTKTKYDSPELCCAGEFGWMNQGYCAAISQEIDYVGTNEYYLDSTEQICVKDCDGAAPCGGVLTRGSVALYGPDDDDVAAIAECCAQELSWIDDAICESQSNPDVDGTNQWHVEGGLCKQDCVGAGDHCSSASRYTNLFDTVELCCSTGLGYLDQDYCISRSEDLSTTGGSYPTPGYTSKWYVKWSAFACAQDCETGTADACEALSSNTVLHDSAAACCAAHLGTVDSDVCEQASTDGVASGAVDASGTGQFYADYSTAPGRCVQDCPTGGDPNCGGVAPSNAGVSLYADAAACCAGKFSWYQQDLCTVISENAGEGHTDLFYADQGEGQCYQDCDTSTSDACNGRPTDFSQPMYADAAACCAAKLGWINSDTCENKSNNGPNAPTIGTDQWYVNWQTNTCDKDCDESNGGGCQGVHDGQYTTFYDDAEACCSAHFGHIDNEFCASRSREEDGSGRFYPDQGAGKCYQDCPTSGGNLCNGPPSNLSVKMYDDVEACCSGSIGWVSEATCAGASDADLATDQYYANWQLNKCVKNCPEDPSDAACGGIAPTWHDTFYNDASSCCSQPAFAWMGSISDCVKS